MRTRLRNAATFVALIAAVACASDEAVDVAGELASDAGAALVDAGTALMDAGRTLQEASAGDARAAVDSRVSTALDARPNAAVDSAARVEGGARDALAEAAQRPGQAPGEVGESGATDSAPSVADAERTPPRAPAEANCTLSVVSHADYRAASGFLGGSFYETRQVYAVFDVDRDDVLEAMICGANTPDPAFTCPANADCTTTGEIPADDCSSTIARFSGGRAYVHCGSEVTQHLITSTGTTHVAQGRTYQRARILLR